MKNYQILAVALLALTSCSVRPGDQSAVQKSDTAEAVNDTASAAKTLTATMRVKETIAKGDSVILTFTVKNNATDSLRFCKWHTPFEPLMSKYLSIKDESGTEAAYKGPMAKRIMPPPASSYITLKPNDSVTVNVDVLKAYAIDKPEAYTVTYEGKEISGLEVKQNATFKYTK
ncbi:protease [Mucilaginibacter sp.]|uniref:protease n=1 Tax=Mucilaginibacter sp. TaxID=1882438 RepID=UPI0035BC1D2F